MREYNLRNSGPSSTTIPRELPPFLENRAIISFGNICWVQAGRVPGISLIDSISNKKISHSLEINTASSLKVTESQTCLFCLSNQSLLIFLAEVTHRTLTGFIFSTSAAKSDMLRTRLVVYNFLIEVNSLSAEGLTSGLVYAIVVPDRYALNSGIQAKKMYACTYESSRSSRARFVKACIMSRDFAPNPSRDIPLCSILIKRIITD